MGKQGVILKIAVIGAGGIGGYFGGRLAASGHDVSFVARGEHLEALQNNGLTVESVAGHFSVSPLRATSDTRDIGEVDFVLLCVKTWQLAPAIAALGPLIGADTAVVTLQNGVEAPAQVVEAVGEGVVLPGLAKIFANLDGPGRVRHVGGPALLTFAEWDNRTTQRVERLRTAFAESGVTAVVPEDIWTELWAKFLFVVPFGGVGAVTDAPVGVLRTREGTRRLLVDGMREIQQVGQAMGIKMADDVVQTTLAFIDQQPTAGISSLQRDILSGHRSELEAWNGAVARLGARTATPTPVNSFLYEVLNVREARAVESAETAC